MIGEEFEIGFRFPWSIVRAEAEVFIELVRVDQLAGVHLPFGIPDRLEVAEGLDEFGTKHSWQQLAAGLAVPVLAGDGAAVADYEIGSFLYELAELGDA